MRHDSFHKSGLAAILLGTLGVPVVFAAPPAPHDMGRFIDRQGDQSLTVTVAMKLNNLAAAEELMQHLATPGDPLQGKFLTPAQVRSQFGPTEADVAHVSSALNAAGLTVERSTLTTLSVSGHASVFEKVFHTSLHEFSAAASGSRPAYTFRAATGELTLPAAWSSSVHGVIGFNTAPQLRPHLHRSPVATPLLPPDRESTNTVNPPGELTVVDFAKLYDVNPLYHAGVSGAGSTIGIVTLASFTHSDPFRYWQSLNLDVKADRIKVVSVDGGAGPPSDASGSDETALDIEQSGGIAPGANMIVYEAPNTDQGFVDAFARAADDNRADSLSTSFGEWEWFDSAANEDYVTNPVLRDTTSALKAMHDVFVVSALQGQSLFAAAGDSGAYDSFDELPASFSTPLDVDYPGSDPAITSSGGTTLPGEQLFGLPDGTTLAINVPQERVWGWDYLEPLCEKLDLSPVDCGIFPVGGGGGVSVFFPMPSYQQGIAGTQLSQPGQKLIDSSTTPPTLYFVLPKYFQGRNVPDVSFNADPDTGYVVFYTSDGTSPGIPPGFGEDAGFGGTSFVGPQLNGVTALLVQTVHHRLGLLNPAIYQIERFGLTRGPNPVIKPIKAGDNWFYDARNGYSPAAGVGEIDVSNLAEILR